MSSSLTSRRPLALPEVRNLREGGPDPLPEGRFALERTLLLESGTTLRGEAKKTILAIGKPGEWPGIALFASAEDARAYTAENNVVERDGEKTLVAKIAGENIIQGYKVSGHKTADIIVLGHKTVCEGNAGARVVRRNRE